MNSCSNLPTSTSENEEENTNLDYDKETVEGEIAVKIICLGDSAVGKSK